MAKPRLNLRLVARFNHFHLDGIFLFAVQVRPPRRHTDPAYGRPSRLFIVSRRHFEPGLL